MKQNPTISVIMPVYKVSKRHFKVALRSILTQSFRDFELIIVFDGVDQKSYINMSKSDRRIIIINNLKNEGISYSLNRAVSISTGEYIFRMDADDVSHKDRFAIQLKSLVAGNSIVSSGCFMIDNNDKIIGMSKIYPLHNLIRRIMMYCLRLNPVIHSSVAAKRNIFVNNPYNESLRYAQDYELWFRIRKDFKFLFLRERLIYYRESKGSSEIEDYRNKVKHQMWAKGVLK
jgi:glycosyltransferase involved in cell wall biosynthesis